MADDTIRGGVGMIFWGMLILLVDLRINNFDLINDLAGILLVTFGLLTLTKVITHPPSQERCRLALAVAVADTVIVALIVLTNSASTGLLGSVDTILAISGALLLADGLRLLALAQGVERLAAMWKRTFQLVLILGAIPLGLLQVVAFVSLLNGRKAQHYNTPLAIPLVLVALIPVVSLLSSLNTTRRDGDLLGPPSPQ